MVQHLFLHKLISLFETSAKFNDEVYSEGFVLNLSSFLLMDYSTTRDLQKGEIQVVNVRGKGGDKFDLYLPELGVRHILGNGLGEVL